MGDGNGTADRKGRIGRDVAGETRRAGVHGSGQRERREVTEKIPPLVGNMQEYGDG